MSMRAHKPKAKIHTHKLHVNQWRHLGTFWWLSLRPHSSCSQDEPCRGEEEQLAHNDLVKLRHTINKCRHYPQPQLESPEPPHYIPQ